jgi:hypothetical protein
LPKEQSLAPCEILHIDTEKSQEFFGRFKCSEQEKSNCQEYVSTVFGRCCANHGGEVRHWEGDGGFALFRAAKDTGKSIAAAREFLAELQALTLQTASTLGKEANPAEARRRFRIKAHFGLVYLNDSGVDAGRAADFDAFLKNERKLAPLTDELFITDKLWEQLSNRARDQFVQHAPKRSYGRLKTALHRLKAEFRPPQAPIPFARGEMSSGETAFLKSQLDNQLLVASARNIITTTLMREMAETNTRAFSGEKLRDLTIQSIHYYLRNVSLSPEFNLVYWRIAPATNRLRSVFAYPPRAASKSREVDCDDTRYQVARAFISGQPIITEDVVESRNLRDWLDFDQAQADRGRGLYSSMQLPVYRATNDLGKYTKKKVMGVLSIDCDKPGFFQRKNSDLWRLSFIGFLANLALAEQMNLPQVHQHSDPGGSDE